MSCRLTALSTFLLLFLLRAQSVSLSNDFELPEVDGSAVDDTCKIFSVPTPDPITTTTTTTTTTAATPPPITRKAVKPDVQMPPKKPQTKDSGAPVRPQPAPAGPAWNNRRNPAADLLYYLLTHSRGRAAASLPGFNRFLSQPIRGLTSDSDELAAVLPKRAAGKRWTVGSFSSEDSSDEF